VAQLKAAGVFRMSMPRAWGGPEMTPREQYDVYEILGASDASVAWCVKIGSDSGYYAALLDDSVARAVYKELHDVKAAGGGARSTRSSTTSRRGRSRPTAKPSESRMGTVSPAAGPSAAVRLTPTS